jgi:hypothetical protein
MELILHDTCKFWSRYDSVSAVTRLRAMYRGSNSGRSVNVSFLHNTQTGSRCHPGLVPKGYPGVFLI